MPDTDSVKTVLVTGGSRGIGKAICEILAPDWRVLVGGHSSESVAPLVAALDAGSGPGAAGFVADLSDEQDTARAAGQVGRLDALVHSAGIATSGAIGQLGRSAWRRIFEINVIAVADLTRLLLPALRRSHGDVVLINSGSGFVSGAGGGLYSASKFALRALADSLREEERGRVRVTSIHPGRTDTDMQVDLQAQLGRPYVPAEHLRPESVARAVKLALDTGDEGMIESLSIRPVFKS